MEVTLVLSEIHLNALYTALLAYNPDDDPEGGTTVDRGALRTLEDILEVATRATVTYQGA